MIGEIPNCSVVIRAYNEEKHLGRLLDGLLQQSHPATEIILVDSGSTDGTLEIVRRYPVKVVHIQPEEFSFGRSLNRGIAAAHAPIVVIASAHVYPVYPDWLERLLAPFVNLKVGLVYGKQRGSSESFFSEEQIFKAWYAEQSNPRQEQPFCNNANAAIRRELWVDEPYDESLSGLEDLDWANRLLRKGYYLAYSAEAEVVHIHHETPRGVAHRYQREAMAFKKIFPQEHFNLVDFGRLLARNILNDIRQAGRQKCLQSHFIEIIWFRWMQFWGTYRGYRKAGPLTWQLRQTFYYPVNHEPHPLPAERRVKPIRYNE